ncbi:MAG: hypothetical protein CFE46_17880 [Burkholderiales bacterium PBB6]|nr:MAG: hypothetical protein CFE46_17880 [Burkholderiales bacterium PBB6]
MTAPIFIKDVWPDPHFKKIGEHFDLCSRAQLAEDRQALAAELNSLTSFYVICFTNRCGSNHLAQCLASDGRLMQASEVLNEEAVINNALKHGFTSFDQYLTWLIKTQKGAHGVFGLKASAGQLLGLYNLGILKLLGPRLKLIHSFRREVMAQAVSLFIANKTKRWTSTQTAQAGEDAVQYNSVELMAIANSICHQNALLTLLFNVMQLDAAKVPYDKLVEEPEKVVRRLGRQLGVTQLRLVPEKLAYQKQADALNDRLLMQLAADHSLGGTGAPPPMPEP